MLAANKGQQQLDKYVEERLLRSEERKLAFRNTLPKNKYLTFEVQQSDARCRKTVAVKAERNILQRLIAAYKAGRPVNLNSILIHELFAVPLALAEVNGQLRTGSKAVLAEVLTADVPCPDHLDATDLEEDAVLIKKKDKHCLLLLENQIQQRHLDILQTLFETVFQSGAQFRRIDVMFDSYFQNSIKSGTRKWREKTQLPSGDL